jgi:hypothetical protein
MAGVGAGVSSLAITLTPAALYVQAQAHWRRTSGGQSRQRNRPVE